MCCSCLVCTAEWARRKPRSAVSWLRPQIHSQVPQAGARLRQELPLCHGRPEARLREAKRCQVCGHWHGRTRAFRGSWKVASFCGIPELVSGEIILTRARLQRKDAPVDIYRCSWPYMCPWDVWHCKVWNAWYVDRNSLEFLISYITPKVARTTLGGIGIKKKLIRDQKQLIRKEERK